MKNILFAIFFLVAGIAHSQCPILPTPSGYSPINGFLILKDTLRINAPEMMPTTYDYLEKELAMRSIVLSNVKEKADLKVLMVKHGVNNSYEMNIAEKIVITHNSHESAFYGLNSLLQMIIDKDGKQVVQKCFINDEPRFDWRGLHLDVSRHFFSVDEVKHFIDIMALYKFNKFHWHLTDDQGWRIEIKKYPKLTSVGGFRDSTVIGHFSDQPRMYDTKRYGGFYTQEEIKEVVAYAASKFIDVIPEIEMPGHSRAALAAYPEYSCNGELQEVPGLWGVFDDIYCSKQETIQFMQDILTEVLELFPSQYIHIGGDEAPKVRWKQCRDCQKVIKKNDLKDEHELQSYFIRQMDAFLTERGRKLIGWDEILEGGLSPNAAVMSWRGEAGGIEAAKLGHNVVMSPTTFCYFDYYQSSHDIEPLAIGGYLPLEKVYRYNPVPEELTEEQEKYILGGQANLWTEYMADMDHVEYMAFPRALALIQSLWCTNKPDYETFLNIYLSNHEDYLALHDVSFAKSIHYPIIQIERSKEGINIGFKGVDDESVFKVRQFVPGFSDFSENLILKGDERMSFARKDNEKASDFLVSSDGYEGYVSYSFDFHDDIGRSIDLITEAHPKYNNNGSLNLVDGIHGGETFKGSEWLGFRESRIEMIVEVEKEKELNGLEIGFKDNNGSWIYLPEQVIIYSSNDKKNWKEVGTASNFKDGKNLVSFTSVKSKFIKVIVVALDKIPAGKGGAGGVPWTFIDEIDFF